MAAPVVMIIDAEQPILDLLSEVLAEEGYDVRACHRSTFTFRDVVQLKPALIVSDYSHRDELQNRQLIAQLRHTDMVATIPLILCPTNSLLVDSSRAWLEANNIVVVQKPYDLDALVAAVAHRLSMCQT